MNLDVVVVGGGPAGTVAATLMRRAGRSVAILDPQKKPPHKVGESLPAAGNAFLKHIGLSGVEETETAIAITGTKSLWAGEALERNAISHPGEPDWRLDRLAFDRVLLDQVIVVGTKLYDATLAGLTRDGDGWRLTLSDGSELSCGFIIDASGRASVLAKKLKLDLHQDHPLSAVWAVGAPLEDDGPTATFIESTATGWWYGAYLPDRRPIIAFHTDVETASRLMADPDRYRGDLGATRLLSRFISEDLLSQAQLTRTAIATQYLDRPYGEGWVACGDAALALDPLSSQGIFNALATAHQAATAYLATDQEAALQAYADRLTEIRTIYQGRRSGLYHLGLGHHQTDFWRAQAT